MGFSAAIIFLILLAAIATLVWGMTIGSRSLIVTIAGSLICLVAAVCAWYSWVESNSAPWSIGYAMVAVFAVLSVVINWRRR